MPNEYVSKEELEKERTPSELWDWLIQKVNQICANEEGRRAFRLQNDKEKHIKKLVEEVGPLAIFGKHKFDDTDQVLLQPIIGNQNYDAVVTDLRTVPASKGYIEITQSHEGEDGYWRRCELLKEGYVFSKAPVIKKGKGKSLTVSIPPVAIWRTVSSRRPPEWRYCICSRRSARFAAARFRSLACRDWW